ncbi:MAG: hypothetical protein MUP30_07485 [Deltaproteobacteria bacterium]|nr:hypothetical protein [Deltaproteobacteria bacterium]
MKYNPLSWYRQLKNRLFGWYLRLLPGDQIVVKTVALLIAGEVFFTALYLIVPPGWQAMVLFQGVLWSETTSIGALYYALKMARGYYNTEATIKKKAGEKLGGNVLQKLEEMAVKVDKRLSELTPEQRTKLLSVAEKGIDFALDHFDKLGEEKPKPKRKKVKVMK